MEKDTIVNIDNPLEPDYVPEDLIEYKEYNGPKINPNAKTLVPKEVFNAFEELNNDAQKNGYYFIIDSCYRSYYYQKEVFDFNVNDNSLEYAKKYVAFPGTSEHQLGFAIDVALLKNNKYTDEFSDTCEEIVWLHKNAYKYGFILRYPKGYETITGYNYEYWHIRYVGKDVSNYMHENDIKTLEEYHEIIKRRLT